MSAAEKLTEVEIENEVVPVLTERESLFASFGLTSDEAEGLGNQFAQVRQSRGLSIFDMAKVLRIRERYIEAMELGRWDLLPSGVNGRGLLRIYAKELGISAPEIQHNEFIPITTPSASPSFQNTIEEVRVMSRAEYQQSHVSTRFLNDRATDQSQLRYVRSAAPGAFAKMPPIAKAQYYGSIVTPNAADVLGLKNIPQIPPIGPIQPPRSPHTPKQPPVATHSIRKPVESTQATLKKNFHPKDFFKNHPLSKMFQNIYELHAKKILIGGVSTAVVFVGFGFMVQSLRHAARFVEHPVLTIEDSDPKFSEIFLPMKPLQTTPSILESNRLPSSVGIPLASPQTAHLDIASSVHLDILADGQSFFHGVHPLGSVDIPFHDRLEISVQDGSQVKLRYAGWDHGTLGFSGRKRKLILNAWPYQAND